MYCCCIVCLYFSISTLFRNKRFMLDEMWKHLPYFWNTKPHTVSFRATLFFYLIDALIYVDRDRAFIRDKNKVVWNTFGKFWSVLLEHFIKHKALISEEWVLPLLFYSILQKIRMRTWSFCRWCISRFLKMYWEKDYLIRSKVAKTKY